MHKETVHNYYVLVLLMAGVIDDAQSALNELLRAKNLPVSILIVKVGNNEERDQKILIEKASKLLKEQERSFVNLVETESFKTKGELDHDRLCFELVKSIPAQLEGYFELGSFDLDVTQAILNSPTHTILSTSDQASPNSG